MMLYRVLPALAVLCVTPSIASAQQGVSRAVPETRPDQQSPRLERRNDRAPAVVGAATTALSVAPFVLQSVEVRSSSLSPDVLAEAYRPFLGRTSLASDIQALTDAVARAYRSSDIALYTVTVPDQDLSAGRLRIDVLEGRIENVQFQGEETGRAAPLVQAHIERLTAEDPLKRSTLQREISLIRDIPGLRTQMELLNGEQANSVTLRVDSKLEPVQFAFGVNNRGTVFLGRTQVQGDLILNSMARAGDQTKLTYAGPIEDDLFRFGALSHSTPIGVNGDSFALNASYLRTNPATTALEGTAKSFGLQYTRPIIRSYDQDFLVTVGLDGVNADNALFGTVFSDDRSRAARVAVAYTVTRSNSLAFAVASVSQGVDLAGASTRTPLFTDLSFTKYNLRLGFSRALAPSIALRLKAAGQMTDDRLPSSEQLALGGLEYGRAYESAIVAGDRGYGASAELAFQPGRIPVRLQGSEVYAFADRGEVTFLARDVLAEQTLSLASVGAGMRLNLRSKAVVEVEAARGLSNRFMFLDDRGWRGIVTLRSLF